VAFPAASTALLLPPPAAVAFSPAGVAVALPAGVVAFPAVALPAVEELEAATVELPTVVSLPSGAVALVSDALLSEPLVSFADGFIALAFTELVSESTEPTWLEIALFDASADRFSCAARAVLLASALNAVWFLSWASFCSGVAPFTAVRFTATGLGVVADDGVAPLTESLAALLVPFVLFLPVLLVPLAKPALAAATAALAAAAESFAAVALTAVALAEPFELLVAL
jgi:hypothetical protein